LQQQHKHTVSIMSACWQRSKIGNNSRHDSSGNSSMRVRCAATARCKRGRCVLGWCRCNSAFGSSRYDGGTGKGGSHSRSVVISAIATRSRQQQSPAQ
jgi:hypothetical protein